MEVVVSRVGEKRTRSESSGSDLDAYEYRAQRRCLDEAARGGGDISEAEVHMAYSYLNGFIDTLRALRSQPELVFGPLEGGEADDGVRHMTLFEVLHQSALKHYRQQYGRGGGGDESDDDDEDAAEQRDDELPLPDDEGAAGTWARDCDILRQRESVEVLFGRMCQQNGGVDTAQVHRMRNTVYRYFELVVARMYHMWTRAFEAATADFTHVDMTPLCWHFHVRGEAMTADISTYDLDERYNAIQAQMGELQQFAIRERLHLSREYVERCAAAAAAEGDAPVEEADAEAGGGDEEAAPSTTYDPTDETQHSRVWVQLTHICRSAHIAISLISDLNAFRLQLAMPVQPLAKVDTRTFDGFRPSPYLDVSEQKPHLQVCEYLLAKANQRGLRRYGKYVYLPRVVPVPGRDTMAFTYSWKRSASMVKWVESMCSRSTNIDMYKLYMDNLSNISKIVDRLCDMDDPLMADICKDRHMFSFTNGIFCADTCCFYAYGDPAMPHFQAHAAKFFPHPFPEALYEQYRRAGSSLEALMEQEHDVRFAVAASRRVGDTPEFREWCRVFCEHVGDTPSFEQIFKYQDLSPEVRFWVYALTGRMMFKVNECDSWQVALFVKGVAGSGKSTYVVGTIGRLYDPEDVGILSNTFEKKFGLAPLAKRLILIGPDIKENFSLDSAQFQSIVSGEAVSAAAKNRDPTETDAWEAPVAMAGNKVMDWQDNAGSLARRQVVVQMDRTVNPDNMKGDLGELIRANMPTIIFKCALAYRFASQRWGSKSFWSVVPSYFLEQQQRLQAQTNSLVGFLCSEGKMEFARDDPACAEGDEAEVQQCMRRYRTPVVVFREQFKSYCSQMDIKVPRWNEDLFQQPFQSRGIELVTPKEADRFDPEHLEWPRGERFTRGRDLTYLEGVYVYGAADMTGMTIPTEPPAGWSGGTPGGVMDF